ncbi:peptidoglycan editing factor PgeF [Prochlorococcus sp. AH-716-K03]|nr:peptidoglycan editing factor PgeF [Prochlorococcus sp. AH-716-K03]
MAHNQKCYQEHGFTLKDKYFKYYLSPLLFKNNFKHGFFTKTSSEIKLSFLSNYINKNNRDCVLNQIHSNRIVFGTKTEGNEKVEADGLINDKQNQTLWIYTADCMPILFADKRKRCVAAIHCGRKGLEIKIIKNLIKKLYSKGCSNEDLLVAIGPSISKKNYLIDNKTLQNFHKQTAHKKSISRPDDRRILLELQKKTSVHLNLKKYAYIQLLDENIPNSNIDISNLCTFDSNHEFFSWRRSKTPSRQWTFISS